MIEPRVLSNRIVISELQYPAADLCLIMSEIISTRRTGSLKINFVDGAPLGTVEWVQRTDKGLDTFGAFTLLFESGDQSVSG